MAASSPIPSTNNSDTTTTTATATVTTATTPQRSDPPKNLRGLNKPKCSKCGNVARSRCPYKSCKSCCAKAQNPCHIHVLKPNATFPDKSPTSSSPLFDQPSTDVSTSGTSLRVSALRQLSNNFAQLNGAQSPLRSRKPLTRKDAAVINQWRFSKLQEYKDRNIETENEAFDRYMRNVSLLEEVFLENSSLEGPTTDMLSLPDTSTSDEGNARRAAILGSKVKQRSNPVRTDGIRERIQELVDQGLKNLQNWELDDEGGPASADDLNSQEPKRPKKIKNWRAEKLSAVSDIIEKLNKARNEDDLKSCLELKSQLFNQHDKANLSQSEDVETSKEKAAEDVSTTKTESDYSLPGLFYKVEVNEEAFNSMEAHFSSIDQIEDL